MGETVSKAVLRLLGRAFVLAGSTENRHCSPLHNTPPFFAWTMTKN